MSHCGRAGRYNQWKLLLTVEQPWFEGWRKTSRHRGAPAQPLKGTALHLAKHSIGGITSVLELFWRLQAVGWRAGSPPPRGLRSLTIAEPGPPAHACRQACFLVCKSLLDAEPMRTCCRGGGPSAQMMQRRCRGDAEYTGRDRCCATPPRCRRRAPGPTSAR